MSIDTCSCRSCPADQTTSLYRWRLFRPQQIIFLTLKLSWWSLKLRLKKVQLKDVLTEQFTVLIFNNLLFWLKPLLSLYSLYIKLKTCILSFCTWRVLILGPVVAMLWFLPIPNLNCRLLVKVITQLDLALTEDWSLIIF